MQSIQSEWTSLTQTDLVGQAVQTWLSPTDYAAYMETNFKNWSSESGKWFLEGTQFRQWLDTPSTIWLTGIRGYSAFAVIEVITH